LRVDRSFYILDMAGSKCNRNGDGLPMCHLRRIGPKATKEGVADIME